MADKSKIEWTNATWNPVTGCHKVSQGCRHCYAERDWSRLQHLPAYAGRKFTDVQCHPDRLDQPLRWTKPRLIFVNSMSDLFHEAVPDAFIDQVFAVMALAAQHTFQVLTKRPTRMLAFLSAADRAEKVGWAEHELSERVGRLPAGAYKGPTHRRLPLPNVWLGVSVEDQTTADERIPLLLQTPAAVRWLSMEPLLEPVMLDTFLGPMPEDNDGAPYPGAIDWVVVGGESGPRARPMHPDWVRSVRDQCAAAGTPFFFKQWGEYVPYEHDAQPPFVFSQHGDLFDAHGLPDFESSDGAKQREWVCDDYNFLLARRVGKRAAGRRLDGRTHDEYPEVRA